MTERPVRGVVFDLDGTLIDSYRAIAASLNHARERFGLRPLPLRTVRSVVGHGLESLIADHVGPERVQAGVELFRERYAQVFREGTSLLDGVRPTLEQLAQRGVRLSVASNKPARFSIEILREFELLETFDCVLGPDVVGSTKPDPAMILGCVERMRIPPDQAIYVGDMVLDVESGRRAGVTVWLVEGGSASVEELRATGRPVLASLGALLQEIEL